MSDLANWKVPGPVKTLRSEFATWDPDQKKWQPGQHFTATWFRPDGRISMSDSHNPGGSISHARWLYDDKGQLTETNSWRNDEPADRVLCSYDQAGRLVRTFDLSHDGTETDLEVCSYDAGGKRTRVRFLSPVEAPRSSTGELCAHTGYGIEGTDMALGAPGATLITTTYDERELHVKTILQDAESTPLRYVIFQRDSAGKLENVEVSLGPRSLVESYPVEKRDTMTLFLKQAFGDVFSRTAYSYDTQGRLLERTDTMGSLGGTRTSYCYNDHDDPIEETAERRSRGANIDESGAVHYSPDTVNVHHNRLEYRYDAQGNWTEKTVSFRTEPNPEFQLSNMERRAITYHTVA